MSRILVDQVRSNSASGDAITLDGNGKCAINATTINSLTFPTSDGSANQLIKTNGSGALSFVDSAVGGKVLQVIEKQMTGDAQISSTDYQQINGIQQSITLASTSSKVLIFVRLVQTNAYNSNTSRRSRTQLYRGSVASGTVIDYNLTGSWGFSGSSWTYDHSSMNLQALDSPSTAGSVTYNVGVRTVDSGSQYCEIYGEGTQSSMILMELSS
jgi:hypothetical protein